jgi:hypothetical protein
MSIAKIKINLDIAGRGAVLLNGMDIGDCLQSIEFKARANQLTAVVLTINADVDAEIETVLGEITRKNAEQPDDRNQLRTMDGRVIRPRSRAPG